MRNLKRIHFFEVMPDLTVLTESEKSAVGHCVSAIRSLTAAFYRQVSPDNPLLRDGLDMNDRAERLELIRYLEINGGPWDRFDENQPFLSGIGSKPLGAGFYPQDLTPGEWEAWLHAHPQDRDSFESPYTNIARVGERLVAVPYASLYADFLKEAARELRRAADLLADGALHEFLKLRADSFETNDYWKSDLEWVDTNGVPFELTIGPYEVYEDQLFGLKATFEGFIGVLDREATRRQRSFANAVPDFDRALASRFGYRPRAAVSPPEVVDDIYRGGNAGCGRQFVAFNLPNDRRIHEEKGSKKVISRTMMEAKFSKIGQPIAERLLGPNQFDHYRFDQRLLFVLAHEFAHGIGPTSVKRGDREVSFEVALRDLHSCIEEAKADALGARLLRGFSEQGLVNADVLSEGLVAELVQYIQEWRTGFREAHSAASLIEYNWIRARGGLNYDRNRHIFIVDGGKMLTALGELSEELIILELQADYDQAARFVADWSRIPGEIPEVIANLQDLPVEVFPIYRV